MNNRNRSRPRFRSKLFRGLSFATVALIAYLWLFHSYTSPLRSHPIEPSDTCTPVAKARPAGSDGRNVPDADGDGIDDASDIARNARGLLGIGYDFSQGKFDNLGGRLGLVVCVDVPRLAYAGAGISLEKLLKDDFAAHPSHYDTDGGRNTPASPFFGRRVRNLYVYCHGNGCLIEKCGEPKVGDLVFYGRVHVALVVEVHGDGTYDEIEAAPAALVVAEHRHKRWVARDVGRILEPERQP
jgi:uncharacterized protein YijF (DUF1287 family)